MEYYSKEIPGQAGNDWFDAHAKHMAGMTDLNVGGN